MGQVTFDRLSTVWEDGPVAREEREEDLAAAAAAADDGGGGKASPIPLPLGFIPGVVVGIPFTVDAAAAAADECEEPTERAEVERQVAKDGCAPT